MADETQLTLLRQGVAVWNQWRKEHPETAIDLSEANLIGANLRGVDLSSAISVDGYLSHVDLSFANFSKANLREADLSGATLSGATLSDTNLIRANLSAADLSEADLSEADLWKANLTVADLSRADLTVADLNSADLTLANLSSADLSSADLSSADLSSADLSDANLSSADLSKANLTNTCFSEANLSDARLEQALLIGTDFAGATLTHCSVYGIAAWNVHVENAIQENLVITQFDEPTITIDNIKMAQFVYLMLNNQDIRDVITTLTTKSVLILGRFTPERKAILDALRQTLRTSDYLPILFDFDKPHSRNFTETVRTLAHLSRFIIADLTEPSSIPQELQAIIPTLAIPVKPILLHDKKENAMFLDFLTTYHWTLPIHYYHDLNHLLTTLKDHIIDPAERKARELEQR